MTDRMSFDNGTITTAAIGAVLALTAPVLAAGDPLAIFSGVVFGLLAIGLAVAEAARLPFTRRNHYFVMAVGVLALFAPTKFGFTSFADAILLHVLAAFALICVGAWRMIPGAREGSPQPGDS